MKFFNKIKQATKEIIYKIMSALLSSFLFTNILPIFMFIIYMQEKSFFSYDLFTSGLFGMNVFFFYGILTIFLLIFFMTSSLFLGVGIIVKSICPKLKKEITTPTFCKYDRVIMGKQEYKKYLGKAIVFFVIVLIVNIIFIQAIYKQNPLTTDYVTLILIMSSIMTVHFSIVFYIKAKFSILSLLILFPISVFILFSNSDKTAHIVEFGLETFNSANKIVIIKDINNAEVFRGKLLLLSPENVFISTNENNETNRTRIIKRDNIIIDIKN